MRCAVRGQRFVCWVGGAVRFGQAAVYVVDVLEVVVAVLIVDLWLDVDVDVVVALVGLEERQDGVEVVGLLMG